MFIRLKSTFFLVALFAIILIMIVKPLFAAESLKVVATQAMYADIVKQIGKDKVDVKFVASPKFNVHFIQPKPSDVRNVSHADLVMYTGLDLEEWWGPLLEAAGKPEFFPGREKSIDLSKNIRMLEVPDHPLSRFEGDIHLFGNPHYTMNPENAKIMAQTITQKLKQTDPANANAYQENENQFIKQLDEKIAQWKAMCAHCAGQEILSYHKDICYFADFLGVTTKETIEPKPGIPPTPKHLEFLENYVKEKKIKVIVLPTYFPKDSAEALAKKVNAKVITICQNVGEIPGTDDLFSFFDYNLKAISSALK